MAKKKQKNKAKKKVANSAKRRVFKSSLKKQLRRRLLRQKTQKSAPAGKQAVLPLPTVVAPVIDTEKLLKKLMEKALERGFVTEAEILHTFPYFEDDIGALEKLMSALDKRGIEIVEQEVASVWEQNKAPEVDPNEKPGKGKKSRGAGSRSAGDQILWG